MISILDVDVVAAPLLSQMSLSFRRHCRRRGRNCRSSLVGRHRSCRRRCRRRRRSSYCNYLSASASSLVGVVGVIVVGVIVVGVVVVGVVGVLIAHKASCREVFHSWSNR